MFSPRFIVLIRCLALVWLALASLDAYAQATTEQLYLRAGNELSRTPPPWPETSSVELDEGAAATWTLEPALSMPLTLAAGAFDIQLWLERVSASGDRTLELTLSVDATPLAQGTLVASNLSTSSWLPSSRIGTLNLSTQVTVPAGATLRLTVRNASFDTGNRRVRIHSNPFFRSRVELNVVAMPALSIQKVSAVVADPVNATTNPKRIPGSVLRYTIAVTNSGEGSIDASTLVITDPLPPDVELCVAAACGGALSFTDGVPASGLAFNSATHVTYSSAPSGGAPFTHSPSATPEGYDANIRGIRIAPTGTMNGASSAGSPNFSFTFYVRVR